jgi:hypothetical protein
MLADLLIEEIEGIMILLSLKPNHQVLTALNALPDEEIKAYRNSLAEEWQVKNKSKKLLVIE